MPVAGALALAGALAVALVLALGLGVQLKVLGVSRAALGGGEGGREAAAAHFLEA